MPHALIIGVGPGLGRALALSYADHGFALTLMARNAGYLSELAEEIRPRGVAVHTAPVDISDLEALDSAVSEAGRTQPVSLLHYNASQHSGALLAADPTTLRESLAVNAVGAVVAVQAALPDLRATRGKVMITGGGIALKPRADYGVLAIGKSALRAAAFALAEELAAEGIPLRMLTVNGFIRPGSAFSPEAIAAAFWQLAISEGAEVEELYTGR